MYLIRPILHGTSLVNAFFLLLWTPFFICSCKTEFDHSIWLSVGWLSIINTPKVKALECKDRFQEPFQLIAKITKFALREEGECGYLTNWIIQITRMLRIWTVWNNVSQTSFWSNLKIADRNETCWSPSLLHLMTFNMGLIFCKGLLNI